MSEPQCLTKPEGIASGAALEHLHHEGFDVRHRNASSRRHLRRIDSLLFWRRRSPDSRKEARAALHRIREGRDVRSRLFRTGTRNRNRPFRLLLRVRSHRLPWGNPVSCVRRGLPLIARRRNRKLRTLQRRRRRRYRRGCGCGSFAREARAEGIAHSSRVCPKHPTQKIMRGAWVRHRVSRRKLRHCSERAHRRSDPLRGHELRNDLRIALHE